MTVWFATSNPHKQQELAAILHGHSVKIPSEVGIAFAPEENGVTFIDNVLIKAKALYRLVHAPVIADDSGLCVDALNGRPGVHSARYGSEHSVNLSSEERNALLLKELAKNPLRTARFVCAMSLMLSEDRFFIVQETLEGELCWTASGTGGFGYDPILYLPSMSRTVAELSEVEKNLISHRGKAGRAIRQILETLALP
ncbi:MAG: RdgB/HAM1 family non-canonical purine NTP pyrophosphatase [Treponema sp.]|jgi:XTP/dITP diphosphohydrolase|nr:RdgB/HAM1 family non-canonical purine NTP pyrophosphatase [Treponema sp.]